MSIIPSQNGNFPVKRNEIIFFEGQDTQSLNILLQGKIDVFISPFEEPDGIPEGELVKKSFRIFSSNYNLFLGANDLSTSKKYSFSYRVAEDANIFAFVTKSMDQLKTVVAAQKDYAACIITTNATLIEHAFGALMKLEQFVQSLANLTDNLAVFYWAMREEYGFPGSPSARYFRDGLENLQKLRDQRISVPSRFQPGFFEADYQSIYESDNYFRSRVNTSKVEYYKHLAALPIEVRKNFFSEDFFLTEYHCTDSAKCLNEIQSNLKEAFGAASMYFKRLYSEEGESIFTAYAKAAGEVSSQGQDPTALLNALDYIITKIKGVIVLYETEYAHPCELDMAYLRNMHSHTKSTAAKEDEKSENVSIPEELRDSAMKILEYSEITKEKTERFLSGLEAFRRLKDKLSSEEEAKKIRSVVSSLFYEIYDGVFRKVTAKKDKTRIYHMFLSYGYMDEKLLSPEQTLTLYKMAGKSSAGGLCPVYTMKEWLEKIAEKEREPSINEFGQDYYDMYREAKKRGSIGEKDMLELENDIPGKIKFEIENMFKINQRVCYGQISTHFPILHSDIITRDLSKAAVTAEAVNECIQKILAVDYSVFHREVSYRNPETGLEKEFIMKQVVPDIILMPTFGTRAAMWQEISGRSRSTPGRFIFPAFTGENLEEMVLKVVGNFRWELCRTMMGVSWNDVSQKSLTSEYTDYIQFYRKNKDLSEEAREKIKAQTVKFRNMMREIFTSDYEIWINYESKGNVRLNKVVRNIFYRHCPFVRSIREYLEKQPMYAEVAIQHRNQRTKEARELENHYNKLVKSGIPLDEECAQNLKFYKEL